MRVGWMPEMEGDCGYFPSRRNLYENYLVQSLAPAEVDHLLASGYRLFGRYLFRPRCKECDRCVPLRVPLKGFQYSKSQRRLKRSITGLRVIEGKPALREEKYLLFREHGLGFQAGTPIDYNTFASTYYSNGAPVREFCYEKDNHLVGVGYLLVGANAASTTYFYYGSTGAKMRLGTYSILYELEWCRRNHKAYYYLGYLVPGCARMAYKQWFRPNEVALAPGIWVPFRGHGAGELQRDPASLRCVVGQSDFLLTQRP